MWFSMALDITAVRCTPEVSREFLWRRKTLRIQKGDDWQLVKDDMTQCILPEKDHWSMQIIFWIHRWTCLLLELMPTCTKSLSKCYSRCLPVIAQQSWPSSSQSSASIATSSIIHHPSSIIHHPTSITHHPSSIIHHPSPISHHHHPSSITRHPSPIYHHHSPATRKAYSQTPGVAPFFLRW